MLEIIIGRAQTGKSHRLFQKIAELGDSSRQILLVPEHASHKAEVDLCHACGPTASRHAEVLSFRRLCDRVLNITGGSAQVTLDAGGKLLTLQKALSEVATELKVYSRPSRRSAFLQQLLDLFDELRSYDVTPALLAEQAEAITGVTHDKLHDLSLLYGAYEARLHRPGLDARDRMTKLCDHLEESRYVEGKDVFLDGFTYFNAQERRVLTVLLRQARSVTVALLGEANSREEIFESSLKTMDQLQRMAREAGKPVRLRPVAPKGVSELRHLEQCFFGEHLPWEEPVETIHIREADNMFSEVEQTAAEILRLAAEEQVRFRDITVSARNMSAYTGVIETVFERYHIPAYVSRRSDILEKPVLSLLTGVLAAMGNGYEYEDMFRWLKTGLAGLTAQECDLLENYVLTWEIRGSQWLQEVDWTENPGGYAPWTEEQEARLEEINALRRRVQAPLSRLVAGMKAADTALGMVDALYSFMEELQLQDVLEAQMKEQAAAGRLQEGEETAQLWDILCGVLDQFVEILGQEPMELDEFTRLFRQVVTQYSVGTIPVSLDQVSVSEITRNDRHTTRFLFLLGATDHVIPAVGQGGGILNDDDRKALSERGVELAPTGMEQMGIELQNLYAALTQPTEGLTVSYPVTDVSGAELRPSFLVERMQLLFPALEVEREDLDRSYRLTALQPALETAGQCQDGPLWKYLEQAPDCGEKLEAMRRAAALKRGALSRHAVRKLYGKDVTMSASKLERLRSCHFAYFMEYGLKAKKRETASFAAPQIGTFLHFLLEHVTRDVMDQGGFGQVSDDQLHALVERYITEYEQTELPNLSGRSARFQYLFARLKKTALTVVDQVADEQRHSQFTPLEFELSFGDGKDDQVPAVVVPHPEGELRVGGKVDRVDGWVKDDKLYLRVVDYKSGKKVFDLSDVRMGLSIQMLLYLFALEQKGERHFHQPIVPAGVLYLPARDTILPEERNIGEEDLQAEREKALRRSGLLLNDAEVLEAMEDSALTEPRYLPVKINKKGERSGDLASADQLGKLARYVEKLLEEIHGEIRQGNIEADPCCRSEEDTQCRYCPWADACHFVDGRDTDHYRWIQSVKPEEFWSELE